VTEMFFVVGEFVFQTDSISSTNVGGVAIRQ